MTVHLRPIDPEDFAPYGVVLAPRGDATRLDRFEVLVNQRPQARANLASVRADRYDAPGFQVHTLERHPDSSQTFFPLTAKRYLVVVCPSTAEGAPDTSRLLAFEVPGDVGIHYFPGTWHTGIGVLEGVGDFLMVVHEDGSAGDCEFRSVEPVEVALTPGRPKAQ
ncbi:MAG: ureidoglycolate hydrolase [Comamonadaceae bacterium]|nr:MAG: ureidoglycolate hydrolase [Comamonadaceae bacterium]